MTARAAVFSLLSNDSELETLGCEKVYASNAVDTPKEDVFLIIQWGEVAGPFLPGHVSVWAHDKNHDYGVIDKLLNRVRQIMEAAVHVEGADGWRLSCADWNGEGPDAFDGGFHTLTRYADFTVASMYNQP